MTMWAIIGFSIRVFNEIGAQWLFFAQIINQRFTLLYKSTVMQDPSPGRYLWYSLYTGYGRPVVIYASLGWWFVGDRMKLDVRSTRFHYL
jgi:hypothetical protein